MDRQSDTPRPDRLREQIMRLVRAQEGPVGRAQLVACGLSEPAIDSRVRRGALFAVYPGVYKLTPAPLSRRGALHAALLGLPCPGLLSEGAAAETWGIEKVARPITVTIRPACCSTLRGVRVRRRFVHPADRARRHGLPVTSAPRTLIDLAPYGRRRLRHAFEEAVRLELVTEREMRAACERARGRHAIGLVRDLVDEWTAPAATRTKLESDFRELCRAHGLPLPEVNVKVRGWELDAWWPHARLAVEVDSYAFHGADRFQFDRDRRKGLMLADAGIELIRVGDRDLDDRPAAIARAIGARIAERAPESSGPVDVSSGSGRA